MLNPRLSKYADRLRALIGEGNHVAQNASKDDYLGSYVLKNPPEGYAWSVKGHHILELVFSGSSHHVRQFDAGVGEAYGREEIYRGVACLTAALSDLEGGFLRGQEVAIASEVFDSVLEQARHLNENHYKDPAAVLVRVVLEDALKRLARENSLDDTKNAAAINDALKQAGIYTQIVWRRNQVLFDIGNKAAHGEFAQYSEEDVKRSIDDVEQFLAGFFT